MWEPLVYAPDGQDLEREESLEGEAVCLLAVEFGGRVFRWSSRPCVVTTNEGDEVFDGGLEDLDIPAALALLADTPELPSVPIEVHFPVDVAEMIAEGYDLALAQGELSLWVEGSDWEERQILVRGSVVQPEYGSADEPVTFSLEAAPFDDRALWPPASWKVDEDTWPQADDIDFDDEWSLETPHRPEEAMGAVYPTVYGTAGRMWGSPVESRRTRPGSPAIIIEWAREATNPAAAFEDREWVMFAHKLLIAGHHVKATTVWVWAMDTIDGAWRMAANVENTTDGLGQPVAIVDISAAEGFRRAGATQYFVSWSDDSGGAMPTTGGEGTLSGLGEVIMWWLDRSTLAVDRAAWAAAGTRLNQFKVAGYCDEEVTPWAYVQEHLLGLAPLSIHDGPRGLYPVIWRWDAGEDEAVAHLEAGPGTGIERVSPITYEKHPRDAVSELRFQWAPNLAKDGHLRQTVLQTRPKVPTSANGYHRQYVGSTYVEVADSRLTAAGGGVATTIDSSEVVWDAATAEAHVAWRMVVEGFAHRAVTYVAGPEWHWLDLGDVVTIEDPEVHLFDVALVRGVSRTDHGIELQLQMVTDAVKKRRGTGAGAIGEYVDPTWPPPPDPQEGGGQN